MKTLTHLAAVSVAIAALVQLAVAETKELTFEAQFRNELELKLPGIGKGDQNAQQSFQQLCLKLGAPGREADRAVACTIIAETFSGDLEKTARLWLIKQLHYIGGAECVDALAQSLDSDDELVRDAARRALAANGSPAANKALLSALAEAKGPTRVGVINALGYRADPASVDPLTAALGDQDTAIAAAAANALAKIGNDQAAAALQRALVSTSDAVKANVADACLRCAERLLAAGKRNEAIAIYTELAKPDLPKAIRLAAVRGKLEAAKSSGTP